MDDEKHQYYLWFLIVLALLLFTVSVFYFTKDIPQDQQASVGNGKYLGKVYTVYYTSGVFSPTNLQINIGDTVRFSNDSLVPVRIKSGEGSEVLDLDSISDIPPGGIFSHTFTKRGIFDYRNERKPDQKGTIIVK